MKRQKFSLQTILDLREKAKEKAEEVLAAARAKLGCAHGPA